MGNERKYWGCCRPLRLLKSTSRGEYWGYCRPLRLKKEYKSCRSASETRKRVQAAENICWFHSVVWNIFWVKEIVFLCSFWCMSIYLLYFLLEWAQLFLVIEQTNVLLFRWRVTICCLLFFALEQIFYGTISFKRVKRTVLEDEELLGE